MIATSRRPTGGAPCVVLVALIACALGGLGCQGESELQLPSLAVADAGSTGDASTPPLDAGEGATDHAGDAARDDAGAPGPPPAAPDPNRLDHARLFTCDPSAPPSSPSRVRRLTPAQFGDRSFGDSAPYVRDPRYRFSTDDRDVYLDPAAVDQLIDNALRTAAEQNERRIGWGCMRRVELQEDGIERPTRECLAQWSQEYLMVAWQRPPTPEEVELQVDFADLALDTYGPDGGVILAAARPYTTVQFLMRIEAADDLDADGRQRLGSWQTAQALAAAVTDNTLIDGLYATPESDPHLGPALHALREVAAAGGLLTREEVERELRILLDVPPPVGERGEPGAHENLLRFFQEYLGYPEMVSVFKSGGVILPGSTQFYQPRRLVHMMDLTIAGILAEDRDVLRELLTTDTFYLTGSATRPNYLWTFNLPPEDGGAYGPTPMPAGQRSGVLTHPAWLATHSHNQHTDPHPVHRGKWIYENLLCGAVPALPPTVQAQLPDAPDRSVRHRLEAVTSPDTDPENEYCWGCHRVMDPLGIPFEIYGHRGRYRQEELVGDGSLVPVDAATTLPMLGDPALDGARVADATELTRLLADSERVEGCFVRNAFRFFAGRDETYADACTLVAMRDAYRDNGGSFRELLVALATSDAFLYRHPSPGPQE